MADAWATGNSLPANRAQISGCGTSAASFIAGGEPPPNTESYKFTSLTWSASGSLAGQRKLHGAAGTAASALMLGGWSGSAALSSVEVFNGSTFSSGNALPGVRAGMRAAGSTASAITCCGNTAGNDASSTGTTYTYNGSTWSSGGSAYISKSYGAMGGSGSGSAFDVAGRNSGIVPIDYCSNYNGTSWASSGALPQSKYALCAFGTVSAGVAHGGDNGSTSLSTCHTYNGSTWSTGGSLNVARYDHSDGSVVTVGGGSAACEIYGDNTPSTFGFTDVVDFQTLSTATTSDIVTPTGYTVTVAWSCSGGTASISGGAFASSGTINPGQTVQLKVTSSALYATAVSATVTIGGVSDTWYVTTRNAPIPQIIFL